MILTKFIDHPYSLVCFSWCLLIHLLVYLMSLIRLHHIMLWRKGCRTSYTTYSTFFTSASSSFVWFCNVIQQQKLSLWLTLWLRHLKGALPAVWNSPALHNMRISLSIFHPSRCITWEFTLQFHSSRFHCRKKWFAGCQRFTLLFFYIPSHSNMQKISVLNFFRPP